MIDEKNIVAALSFLIKKQRKAMKMTQQQLAEKVGLSVRHIGKLEDGTYLPKFITYLKLAEVLQFDVSDITGLSQKASPPEETKILNLLKKMKPDELELSRKMLELLVKRGANA